jgi:hypothetical protein
MNFATYFDVQKPFSKIWHVIMNTLYQTITAYHERESKRAFKLVTDNKFDFFKSA